MTAAPLDRTPLVAGEAFVSSRGYSLTPPSDAWRLRSGPTERLDLVVERLADGSPTAVVVVNVFENDDRVLDDMTAQARTFWGASPIATYEESRYFVEGAEHVPAALVRIDRSPQRGGLAIGWLFVARSAGPLFYVAGRSERGISAEETASLVRSFRLVELPAE